MHQFTSRTPHTDVADNVAFSLPRHNIPRITKKIMILHKKLMPKNLKTNIIKENETHEVGKLAVWVGNVNFTLQQNLVQNRNRTYI